MTQVPAEVLAWLHAIHISRLVGLGYVFQDAEASTATEGQAVQRLGEGLPLIYVPPGQP